MWPVRLESATSTPGYQLKVAVRQKTAIEQSMPLLPDVQLSCKTVKLVACSLDLYIDGLLQKDITLLLTHWSYIFLSLTHRYLHNRRLIRTRLNKAWYYTRHIAYRYIDVMITTMAPQFTSLTVVYSIVYSDAIQRKHQNSALLAFVWGIHQDRWIPRTKGQLRGKCFHLMTSSCHVA